MTRMRWTSMRWPALATMAVATSLALGWTFAGDGQAQPPDHTKHAPAATAKTGAAGEPLAEQVRQLRAQVAELQATLAQRPRGRMSGPAGAQGMGMGMMDDMGMGAGAGMAPGGGMGMMGEMSMGSMGGGGQGMAPGMGMMDDMDMMGMGAMGRAQPMAGMAVPSALPGFPGASHLYHIGSTGFFLDHDGKHITLTPQQKASLNQVKEKSLLAAATARRKVDEAEQELWALTGADQPDAERIEAKVREIEKLRGDQRLEFVRAVGEAAQLLTDEQRRALMGTMAEATAAPSPATPR